jgi:hypothetical protein
MHACIACSAAFEAASPQECCSWLLTLDHGLVARACDHCEGPVPHVLLHHWVAEVATDQTLGIKHGVPGVHGDLILGCKQARYTDARGEQSATHKRQREEAWQFAECNKASSAKLSCHAVTDCKAPCT